MTNKNKIFTATLALAAVILFLTVISSTASAASSPTVIEKRLTNHGTALFPALSGNKVVWQDNRNGNWDIYIMDLSNNKQTHTTNLSDQINPVIYENRVVWEDERNGGNDIYLQDLSSKVQTRITKSGKAYNPKIYDNTIVWQDNRSGEMSIYMYDLSTKAETKISTGRAAYNPDINGHRIVWVNIGDWPELAMYDLSTHRVTMLGYDYLRDAKIFGDRIVIQTDPDNIAMYDLSTSTGTTLVPYDTDYALDIYGDKVAYTWTDRMDVNEVWMYDISTSTKTRISKSESASFPDIYNNKIVWQDSRNGGSDIYLATLIYPPVAAFSATPTKGKAPLNVKFTDKSTGSITSMSWNFGDKSTSKVKNPLHKYTKKGTYNVSLTVTSAAGKSIAIKTINVT